MAKVRAIKTPVIIHRHVIIFFASFRWSSSSSWMSSRRSLIRLWSSRYSCRFSLMWLSRLRVSAVIFSFKIAVSIMLSCTSSRGTMSPFSNGKVLFPERCPSSVGGFSSIGMCIFPLYIILTITFCMIFST